VPNTRISRSRVTYYNHIVDLYCCTKEMIVCNMDRQPQYDNALLENVMNILHLLDDFSSRKFLNILNIWCSQGEYIVLLLQPSSYGIHIPIIDIYKWSYIVLVTYSQALQNSYPKIAK
jgi:hypothetical protein